MNRRGLIRAALAGAAVLLVLVAVGRWERGRRADEENRGLAAVLAAVGPLDNGSLSSFRVVHGRFDCVLYRRGSHPYALELCVDTRGRLIEAIDRRSGDPKISSLRDDPSRATVQVDRELVERLIRRMGGQPQ